MMARSIHRSFASTLVAAIIWGSSGCLCFVHPVDPPDKAAKKPCCEVPSCSRSHVYVFFLHGCDPLDCADLAGVSDYVRSLGFNKTYYGQFYHCIHFTNEARRIHADDPDARFVVVAFSAGAMTAELMAHSLEKAEIKIDLLVYLDGFGLHKGAEARPQNVARIINVNSGDWVLAGPTLSGVENIRLSDADHFDTPSHRATLDLLARELTELAWSVPVREDVPIAAANKSLAPSVSKADDTRDEWDFLKQENRYAPAVPVSRPKPAAPPAKEGTMTFERDT